MNEEEGFLKAIRDNPEDEVARSVYADWLEERGDPRAEYLRLEIQLRRTLARLKKLREQLDPTWLLLVSNKCNVVLVSFPHPQKIIVIRLVREVTGMGLKEAKDLVEAAPAVVVKTVPREQAIQIQQRLEEECGAEVRLEPLA
jgi:uncharacterized protein (TIGR02996 family)